MDETIIRVLLIDDDAAFCRQMAQILMDRGYGAEIAHSGPEALELLHGCEGSFDVAVIDQVMGPPNGIETMQELTRFYPAIVVIILTAWGDMTPGERAIELGAYRYMNKPIGNVEELILNIRTAARYGRERQRRMILGALVQAGQQIGGAQDEEELYQRIYDQAEALLPKLDSFVIALWDHLNDAVTFPFCLIDGERKRLSNHQGHSGPIEDVVKSKEPLLLQGDMASFLGERLDPEDSSALSASGIIVPIFLEERVMGTMSAATRYPNVHYSQGHLAIMQALANQAALAIQNVRQLQEARALNDAVTRLATCTGGVAQIQEAIVEEARKLIESHSTYLALRGEDGRPYLASVVPETARGAFEPPRQNGLTRKVMEMRRYLVIEDTHEEPLVKESVLARGVRSILAMPLIYRDRMLGVLLANSRDVRHFIGHDLDLWSIFVTHAAAILYDVQQKEQERERLNRQLRATLEIAQIGREQPERPVIMECITEAVSRALELQGCALIAYDLQQRRFDAQCGIRFDGQTISSVIKPQANLESFLNQPTSIWIAKAARDERLKSIRTLFGDESGGAIVYPLYVEAEPLGLLICGANLRRELGRTRQRLEARTILTWVSMLEDTWRHSLVGKASSIRNYVETARRALEGDQTLLDPYDTIRQSAGQIDRLAKEIADAPVRVPQSWEMQQEVFPLAALVEEVAQRENLPFRLRGSEERIRVNTALEALGDAQVRGYRRWIINVLEILLQNAYRAMTEGGVITIAAQRAGPWAEIRIQDTGSGVPKDIQDRLFKGLAPQIAAKQGMGIGSLLAATIVGEHGGTLELERPGPGDTTVLLRLPLIERDDI